MRLLVVLVVAFGCAVGVLAADKGEPIGEYKGIVAYSNGSDAGTARGDEKYQCVDLIRRYLASIDSSYTLPKLGEAKNLYPRAVAGEFAFLKAKPNGNDEPPYYGEIICWDNHLAIVVTQGLLPKGDHYTVKVFEQNVSSDTAFREVEIGYDKVSRRYSVFPGKGLTPQGWLRVTRGRNQIPPSATMVLVDASVSMVGTPIQDVEQILRDVYRAMPNGHFLGLMNFNDSLQSNGFGLVEVNRSTVGSTVRQVIAERLKGDANIEPALEAAIKELKVVGSPRSRILITSANSKIRGSRLKEFVDECRQRGWQIHSVALGKNPDVVTLGALTKSTGGKLYICERAEEVVPQLLVEWGIGK